MSSVHAVLARGDRVVDGVSPSAEDVAFQDLKAPPTLLEMLNFVGGSLFTREDTGLLEMVLNRTAYDRLPAWPRTRTFDQVAAVPDRFWDDVTAAYWAMRDEHAARLPQDPCRMCGVGEASETFGRAERQVCRVCLDATPSLAALFPRKVAECVRCGIDVLDDRFWAQQRADFGRSLDLCRGCYASRHVVTTADGVVSW